MKINVLQNSLLFIFKKNGIVQIKKPGIHRICKKANTKMYNSKTSLEEQSLNINDYIFDSDILNDLEELVVKDGEFAIRYINEQKVGVYLNGVFHFIKTKEKSNIVVYKKEDFEIKGLSNNLIKYLEKNNIVEDFLVEEGTISFLYVDGKKQQELKPGYYVFNSLNHDLDHRNYDLKVQTVTPQNQELLTKDKVMLRVNCFANYRISDVNFLNDNYADNYHEVIYNLIQMALRSAICNRTLDEVLLEKEAISKVILEYLKDNESNYGISFIDSGVKDIILPGEIKDILNTVLIAEKKAQANVIARREETASTRSLLNTAKLMEENDILYRLKELEIIERIFEKVGNVNLSNSNVLESLENLIGSKRK